MSDNPNRPNQAPTVNTDRQARRHDDQPRPLNPSLQSPPVGGADLDPLGRGIGGGNIMNPRDLRDIRAPHQGGGQSSGETNLPPGAIIPGARFDPFGPPTPPDDPSRRVPPGQTPTGPPGPNPDHFRPPPM